MNFSKLFRRRADYNKFCSLLSKGSEREAVDFFPILNLLNGSKQDSMVQYANALLRLELYAKAQQAYEMAIKSEIDWGERRSKKNSAYFIAYCEYFAEHARSKIEGKQFENWQRKLTYLECMPVSRYLQKYRLPLPRR